MPFHCLDRQRVQKFSSSSRYVDPSFFHVLFNETSPTIEYPTVKMLFIIEHSASTFYVSFPPSNNVQPLLSNNNSFLQSNAPFMKFITSFHLTSLFFFLPHFSGNWRKFRNTICNFLQSFNLDNSLITQSSSIQIDLKMPFHFITSWNTYKILIFRFYASSLMQSRVV